MATKIIKAPPALIRKPFFSDRQIVRYLVQLLALFSGYQVISGTQRDGERRFIDVPAMLGNYQYCATYIMGGGQDNVTVGLPAISLSMTGLRQKDEWRLNPQYSERFRYTQRATDGDGNLLVNEPGKKMTVERAMPAPYDLTFEVSIWASNEDQKLQLLEQILSLYNPDMDLQLSNSPADWSFLTTVWFDGDVKFESVADEKGNWDPAVTATLPFHTVIAMSLPAKVYEDKPIEEIDVRIRQLDLSVDLDQMSIYDTVIIKPTPEELAEYDAGVIDPLENKKNDEDEGKS